MVSTLRDKGKVLIPVFALGRTQELLLLLDEYWEKNSIYRNYGKVYYLNSFARRSNKLFEENTNMMNDRIKKSIEQDGRNPFIFRHVEIPSRAEDWLNVEVNQQPPCVILCSPAMMETGVSRKVLEKIADGEKNKVILTGYCMAVGK